MTDRTSQGWKPDPDKMGNWRAMFEPQARAGQPPGPSPAIPDDAPPDDAPAFDPREYRPWILQRGRSRPAMMLELRRFEPRSGLWQGWVMSYPSLQAVEYIGDRMLSLDFGGRQFMIEGRGLTELARHLQQGAVATVAEHSGNVWPEVIEGPVVSAIKAVGGAAAR